MSQRSPRLAIGFVALVLLGWGAGALWLTIASSTDLTVIRDAAAQRTAAIEGAARVVTWAGSAAVLAPLTLICCLVLLRAGMRQAALAFAFSFTGAALLADAVKLLVERARPPVQHLEAVGSSSFPSGHATQATAFWLSAIFAARAAGASSAGVHALALACVAIVLAVAASRVYLGVHYPGDVVAGIALGYGWTLLSWRTLADPRQL
ncbi:MAG TPA: phosphatase PAP2 family protein [Solirubrobacteraceae bacterium]|nr:phosphatase PAP2 family protein [Solirubrobacteraceae bacterium]